MGLLGFLVRWGHSVKRAQYDARGSPSVPLHFHWPRRGLMKAEAGSAPRAPLSASKPFPGALPPAARLVPHKL